MPVIQACERQSQEDFKLKTSLVYMLSQTEETKIELLILEFHIIKKKTTTFLS